MSINATVDDHPSYCYTGAREHLEGQTCIVFVHGAGLDHTVWQLQSRYLAHHGYNVLVPDLPGHGRSGGAPLESIEAMGEWVVSLLDALDYPRATLVGHSMGSLVCLEAAARLGERAERLVLLGAACPMPVADVLLDAARASEPAAIDMILSWGHAFGAQLGGNPAPGMWMNGGGRRLLERALPGALGKDLAACNAYARGMEAAAEVRCPTRLIVGEEDRMTPPRAARQLTEALADASVMTLAGRGHMLMAEAPDEVLDGIREALV